MSSVHYTKRKGCCEFFLENDFNAEKEVLTGKMFSRTGYYNFRKIAANRSGTVFRAIFPQFNG